MAYQHSARPATQCDKSCDFHLATLFFEKIRAAKYSRKGGNLFKRDSCAGSQAEREKTCKRKRYLDPRRASMREDRFYTAKNKKQQQGQLVQTNDTTRQKKLCIQ